MFESPSSAVNCLVWVQVIVFSFSKKECEALANQLGDLELNNSDEKELLDNVRF